MKLFFNSKNQERSFTIIELLVVITAIGLLIGIVLVATVGVRERAQLARTASWAATNHRVLGANSELVLNFEECRGVANNATATPPFIDLSGNNNHGTCTGAECPRCLDGVPGVTGRALSFDGVDDRVVIPHSASLSAVNAVTVSIWIKATHPSINTLFFPVNRHGHWTFWNTNGPWNIGFEVWVDGDRRSTGHPFFPANIWYLVTGVYNSTDRTIRLFVNGAEVRSVTLSGLSRFNLDVSWGATLIGPASGGKSSIIDDVRIYSAAMPLAYIQEQYLQGLKSLLANNGITEEEYNERIAEFNQHLSKK